MERSLNLQYHPSAFDFMCMKKRHWLWTPGIWLLLGGVLIIVFRWSFKSMGVNINLFTTIYFVGGVGWLPAIICILSRAYYRMWEKTGPYFISDQMSQQCVCNYYQESAKLIFDYVSNRKTFFVTFFVWALMIYTVITGERLTPACANVCMYFWYVLVGFVFPYAISAIVYFIWTLNKMSKLSITKMDFFEGFVNQIKENRAIISLLNWAIVFLFAALAFAMYKSPLGKQLWRWLPLLGFFPLSLFSVSHFTARKLINKAYLIEKERLTSEIDRVSAYDSAENTLLMKIWIKISIREKLREYIADRNTISDWLLLLFTLVGAVGSLIGSLR